MSFIPLGVLAASGAGGGGAFESIATVTASGGETSLSFSSIVGTYKHLQIRGIIRDTYTGASGSTQSYIQFNSDTSANYPRHNLYGNGSTVTAAGVTGSTTIPSIGAATFSGSSNTLIYGVLIIDILDYSSSTKYKTVRSFAGNDTNGAGTVSLNSGLWQSTSAITSIQLPDNAGTGYAAGTKFALYGIKG